MTTLSTRLTSSPARIPRLILGLLLVLTAACSRQPQASDEHLALPPTPVPTASAAAQASPQLDFYSIATTSAENGLVVGTTAPDAVRAGVTILQQGGSAADAALGTVLAQVPLTLGNFISYAGIMELLYYDAETGQVYSMNAGWDVPRAETDPLSIPATQIPFQGTSNPSGRTALVPGFMAGLESAHDRFGSLPFAALFEPAISFARQGVVIDSFQASIIAEFEPVLTRLPETAALFTRQDGQLYQAGDLLYQPLMADTLERVAQEGAAEMYTGDWGKTFVQVIQREGGVISMDDMAAYQPIWTEPVSTSFAGYTIYGPGVPGEGGVSLIEAFNLLEAAGLQRQGHFTRQPESMFWMQQITQASLLSAFDAQGLATLFPGYDLSPESRLTKPTAAWLWEGIQAGDLPLFTPMSGAQNTHSASVVAVDRQGNIAALTHTSNAYLYGGSGINVQGIYIPDPGSYQQSKIHTAGAGNRLPNIINPVIVLEDGLPVWASACIGSVHGETFQRLASVLAFGMDLQKAQQAPTLLYPRIEEDSLRLVGQVFPGEFDPEVIQAVRDLGQPVEVIPLNFDAFALNRGILAVIRIDLQTGWMSAVVPAVLDGFASGY
jgi:gamma-glutamyltranspeptidase/glutathione hydrolase